MSKNIPTNKKLYARVKAEAKKKFDRWPSAYGSAWLVKEYKKRGGGYRKAEEGMEVPEYGYGGGMNYADYAYMYGGEDTDMMEYAKGGGIPERYKNMGFTKVGVKKKSTRPGKKWMVLAKKGDKYKVVHGGFKGMKDFKQHGSAKRKKRFWDRMGGRDSAKAKDPFSPLYWHKRFGTWEGGGEFQPHVMYDPKTGKGYEANKPEDHKRMAAMGYLHEDEMQEMRAGGEYFNEDSMDFYSKGGGIDNPGFKALPPEVQQNILDNMGIGGECYACGGQKGLNKYQTQGETTELDEVLVTDTRLGGIQPRPIPNFLPEIPQLNLANIVMPQRVESIMDDPYDMGDEEEVIQEKEVTQEEPFMDENGKLSNRMLWAMGRIGMANVANNFMEANAARKQEAMQRQNMLTDNFMPMEVASNRGDFEMNTGIFRPDDYVPTQFQSFMAKGGQIGMVDEDILQELIAAGADIEILD
jgi:hypothetical protein